MPSELKPRSLVNIPVAVIADWDADGATSSAMIYYAQYHKGKYPLEGRHEVSLEPSGPRGFPDAVKNILERGGCPRVLLVLDIPFVDAIYNTLVDLYSKCKGLRIVYIDHHYSTIYSSEKLYRLTEEVIVGHRPTALLTYNLLRSVGLQRLTPRLQAFINAVSVLEKERKPKPGEDKMVRMAASISKATTVLRDIELWRKVVLWLASPTPAEAPLSMDVVKRVLEVARKSDQEIEALAKDLVFKARRVGFIKFIDARKEWKSRGASALASKLYKMLRQPLALLVERDDGVKLLIIRTKGTKAYKIAVGLLAENIAENIGGHTSLAVVRLKQGVSIDRLEEALRRLSFKAR
ncbi:MAG: DHH family phosphoesterase [Pyrodictiaceae archaeon]